MVLFFSPFCLKETINDGKDSVYMQSTLSVAVGLSCHLYIQATSHRKNDTDITLMFYHRMCGDFYTWYCFTDILLKEIL